MQISTRSIEVILAGVVLVVGILGGLSTLDRGIWLDEFIMLASTPKEQTAGEFLNVMSDDVHPLLYYGIIQLAHWSGVTDITALRALNILGIALAGWSVWFAHRRGALELSTASVLVALYGSSVIFLGYFAELRNYFITYSASIALSLVWLVMVRSIARGEGWDARVVVGWFVCLIIFVNSHYFATLLGGVMTLSVVAVAVTRRHWRDAALVVAWSLLAALPALGVAIAQAFNDGADLMTWIGTGRAQAVFLMLDFAWLAAGTNFVALACAITSVLFLLERADAWREIHDEILLALTVAAYFALLLLIHVALPIIEARYLIAAGGPIAVLVARLATKPQAPAWGAAAICAFAILVQARTLYVGEAGREGWSNWREGWGASASAVADTVASCPGTEVYINPAFNVSADNPMLIAARRQGQLYYAARFDFSTEEVSAGDALPPAGTCPKVIWLEHIQPPRGDPGRMVSAKEVLAEMGIEVSRPAEAFYAGSGMLVVVE